MLSRWLEQKPKKSWREKLEDSKDLPKVITPKGNNAVSRYGSRMLVPAPLQVDAIMKNGFGRVGL